MKHSPFSLPKVLLPPPHPALPLLMAAVLLPAPFVRAQILPAVKAPAAGPATAPAAPVVPQAILRAEVLSEEVIPGGSANGGDLIFQKITKPLFSAAELAEAAAALAPPPEPTAAQRQ